MTAALMSVEGLEVAYHTDAGTLPALSDVRFEVRESQIVGVVGESGCGKSTLGAALLRLLPPNGEIVGGRVMFEGRDLAGLSSGELREVRGSGIATVFQDPLTSLNPTFTVGQQMIDAQRAHQEGRTSKQALRGQAIDALTRVGIPDAARALTRKGLKQAKQVADWLRPHLTGDCLILASPAKRARQTADALKVLAGRKAMGKVILHP